MIAFASRSGSELPPALGWAGCGRTAFAGAAGSQRIGEVAEAGSMADVLSAFGAGGDAPFLRSLGAYFAAGGGPGLVLNLPASGALPAEERPAWIGEDGGPGHRTGLRSLADFEEVGTIAAPGLLAPDLRRALLSGVPGRDDIFVVLDELPGGETEELPPAMRAALARGWSEGADGVPVPPSGPLLALLEQNDFSERRPECALRALRSDGHPTLTGAPFPSVESWRLWEGLRRSIDLGTRWVVFEQHGDFLRKRLEREVGAFLARLHRLGVLEGRSPEEAFRVRSLTGPRSRVRDGHLLLEIEVRLREGWRTIAGQASDTAGQSSGTEKEDSS